MNKMVSTHSTVLHCLCAIVLLAGCDRREPAPVVPPPAPVCEAPPPSVNATTVVTRLVAQINAGDATGMHARFSRELKAAVPLAALQGMLAAIVEQRGQLTGSAPIAASEREGTFQLTAERGAWKLQIALGDGDIIAGLRVSEADAAAPPVARSVPAGLPFKGEWLVFWGGDRAEVNHHVHEPSQRRAADLVKIDGDGKTHSGAGNALTDYYAYGQEILAMADGVVVTAIDGVPDSAPGELNATSLTGNLIVLEHTGGVHSAYAHLIPGSLKARPGDRVRRGQVIGRCGNSGHSSEPHLHVQFQDGPRLDRSWGVEGVFAEAMVVRDGMSSRRADYSFLKGDRVSPADRGAGKRW